MVFNGHLVIRAAIAAYKSHQFIYSKAYRWPFVSLFRRLSMLFLNMSKETACFTVSGRLFQGSMTLWDQKFLRTSFLFLPSSLSTFKNPLFCLVAVAPSLVWAPSTSFLERCHSSLGKLFRICAPLEVGDHSQGSLLDTFKKIYVSLCPRGPRLCAVLQMRPHIGTEQFRESYFVPVWHCPGYLPEYHVSSFCRFSTLQWWP